jgi:hypothetical protein
VTCSEPLPGATVIGIAGVTGIDGEEVVDDQLFVADTVNW